MKNLRFFFFVNSSPFMFWRNWFWPYVGKWGGHRGVLPPSGFGPPLILPLSNHCLPHFLIFKLEPPSSKLLNPLVEKFLTPKLKNFWFCKKGPNPLVEFWWLPPSRFSELEPPTSKILDPLPEEKNSAKKGQNPLVENFFFLQKRSLPPSWVLVTPPFKDFWVEAPYLKNFGPPTWRKNSAKKRSEPPSWISVTPPFEIFELEPLTSKILDPLTEEKNSAKKVRTP